ncbi:MAG: arsenate reductase ArsC [Deltaproteobacteria bacterium]|nr:arsenate reductase ArsC [Deltaproteobacteria bacterium]
MKKVLFVCMGNSFRSQIAEAFAAEYGKGRLLAHSAGARPAGYVHPMAIQVMEEIGFDIRLRQSKSIDPALLAEMDRVVFLSPDVEVLCPKIPPSAVVERWPIEDAVRLFARGEQRLQAFRVVRDQIEAKVRALAAEFF